MFVCFAHGSIWPIRHVPGDTFNYRIILFILKADQRKYQSSASLALCAGNSPGTGEFPAQMASYAENVTIWRRYHGIHIHVKVRGYIRFTYTNQNSIILHGEDIARKAPLIDHGTYRFLHYITSLYTIFASLCVKKTVFKYTQRNDIILSGKMS